MQLEGENLRHEAMPLLGLYDCTLDPSKVKTLIDVLGAWLLKKATTANVLIFEQHSQRLWTLLNQQITEELSIIPVVTKTD